ncbi:YceD family protein [Plantactinospora sp. KLBMP9567]|uniref:YceD family protein n=1 Tax=unclassified Plantactinospora TaxID=2631981 RepID=UPI002980BD72|nr:YceD family protein [Plantactinospora sp. KLBMP9567]MDW5324058.1 YceD family protein [Plantactinospora sp. KLBMP9567]
MPKHLPTHLNPRSPLVLDTRELPRRPGVLRTVSRTAAAPADLGVELIGVPEGADLSLDLRLESVSEGVLVSGTVTGPIEGECGRCLRPITDSLVVPIQELYAYEHSTTDETTDEDEVGRMQGDLIDLEPALRDAVVLALPTNPVCREDCPGLCPECGVHWDELPAEHSHQQVDPRWAGLSQLTRQEE